MTQAFVSPRGERKLLLINKRQRELEINLAGPDGSKIERSIWPQVRVPLLQSG